MSNASKLRQRKPENDVKGFILLIFLLVVAEAIRNDSIEWNDAVLG
jgi:hypothetical protein